MVFRGWSGPPSLSRQFLHHKHTPFGNKKVLVPLREQGQKDKFLRYHLVCRPKNGRSARCQHTGCPLTLALRQKILRFPVSLCPLRPICCPAFRSALSYAKLSVDALAVLLPLLRFEYLDVLIKHYICPFVKDYFHRAVLYASRFYFAHVCSDFLVISMSNALCFSSEWQYEFRVKTFPRGNAAGSNGKTTSFTAKQLCKK